MADFCKQCGTELGIFSGKKIRLDDGREQTVCSACAKKLEGGAADAAFDGMFGNEPTPRVAPEPGREQAAPAAPDPGRVQATPTTPAASPRAAVISIAALSLLVAAGGVGFMVLSSAGEPAPVAHEAHAPVHVTKVAQPVAPIKAANTAQARADAWDGKGTFRCGASEQVVLRCKHTEQASVRADGSCQLTLDGCELMNLRVLDAAKVSMDGGGVNNASMYAVRVGDSAKVVIKNATLTGMRSAVRVDDQASLALHNVTIRRADEAQKRGRHMPPTALIIYDSGAVTLDGGSIHWPRQAVAAKGTSMVLARNVNFSVDAMLGEKRNTAALVFSDGSRGLIVGGTLKAPETAVLAKGDCSVTIEGAKLEGKTSRAGNAQVKRSEESPNADKSLAELEQLLTRQRDAEKAEYDLVTQYSDQACIGVFECYLDLGRFGPVKGKVTTRVDDQGKLVAIAATGVPGNVAACIRKLNQDRSIPDFKGPPGSLVCEYSGTITAHSRMLSVSADYLKQKPATR